MHDRHLQITQEGSSWRVINPYRSALDDAPPRPARNRDMAIVGAAACAVGVPCTLLITHPAWRVFIALIALVAAVAAAEYLFKARTQRHQAEQAEAAEALTSSLGPPRYSRSDFTDPDLRALGDRAVAGACTVTDSDAFTRGMLGPTAAVSGDLQVALWDCLGTLVDLDARAQQWQQASALADGHHRDDYRALTGRVRTELLADVAAATAAVEALEALADGTAGIDARLAGPTIDHHLENSLTGRTPAGVDSPTRRLAAQLAAAHDVIDARGDSPPLTEISGHWSDHPGLEVGGEEGTPRALPEAPEPDLQD